MNSNSNKRDFERFSAEFFIEVTGQDNEGKKFTDKAQLKDVSGGGALFVSNHVKNYFKGQQLKLTITLPGAGNISANMEGNATVIRTIQLRNADVKKNNQEVSVAVTLDIPLEFDTSVTNQSGLQK
jgi:hypothetical protein